MNINKVNAVKNIIIDIRRCHFYRFE